MVMGVVNCGLEAVSLLRIHVVDDNFLNLLILFEVDVMTLSVATILESLQLISSVVETRTLGPKSSYTPSAVGVAQFSILSEETSLKSFVSKAICTVCHKTLCSST